MAILLAALGNSINYVVDMAIIQKKLLVAPLEWFSIAYLYLMESSEYS